MSDFIINAELRAEAERLCDENDMLQAENIRLRAERSVMRGMLDSGANDSRELVAKLADYMTDNERLRKLVQRMWPAFTGEKRATFADRLHVRAEIDELEITVTDESRANASE